MEEQTDQYNDTLGNETKIVPATHDFIEWMTKNNPLSDMPEQKQNSSKCKSGNCGNNRKTFIIVGALLFLTMWAGYGIFTFIEHLIK